MPVQFEDNRVKVKAAIKEQAIAFLHEVAGELVAQVVRNIPAKGRWFSEQAEQWRYEVDESGLKATVGNPMERSLWTEFGTGEYAVNGDGRKGYWVYVKDSGTGEESAYTGGKSYTLEEAKQIVAIMRADGLDARYTKGQQAYRPLETAFNNFKPKIKQEAERRFGKLND